MSNPPDPAASEPLLRSTETTRTCSSSGTSFCRNHSPYAMNVSTGMMSSSVTRRGIPAAAQ